MASAARPQSPRSHAERGNEVKKNVSTSFILLKITGENIDCTFDFTDKDIKVLADSDKVEQALMNLTKNAVDAMPGGGSLTTFQLVPTLCVGMW